MLIDGDWVRSQRSRDKGIDMTPRAKALQTLQKLVRLKAADDNGYCECVTCGKIAKYTEMDGGHYIPKGNSSYWALDRRQYTPPMQGL